MNFITTTDLRTKSSQLVDSLKKGETVSLIHRSTVVGKITPNNDEDIKTINAKKLAEKVTNLNFPNLTLREVDTKYREAMRKKYGKGLR